MERVSDLFCCTPRRLTGKTMDVVGPLVNLEQVRRIAFCPVCICVCVCVCVYKGVIDWISECMCHWEAEERT